MENYSRLFEMMQCQEDKPFAYKNCFLKADNIGHCNNTVRMNTSLILNGYISKAETPDELLARILDAAACIKKREDQLRRKTRDFRTQVAKCTEDDGGMFE
jgi:hypothetical protein